MVYRLFIPLKRTMLWPALTVEYLILGRQCYLIENAHLQNYSIYHYCPVKITNN